MNTLNFWKGSLFCPLSQEKYPRKSTFHIILKKCVEYYGVGGPIIVATMQVGLFVVFVSVCHLRYSEAEVIAS